MLVSSIFSAIICFIVFALLFVVGFIIATKTKSKNTGYLDANFFSFCSVTFLPGFAFFALIALIATLIPFNSKYWFIENYAGTVASVEARTATDTSGDNLTTQFALTLEGDGQVFLSEDARFLQVEPGDEVDLSCTWEWVYGAGDKLHCLINN